MMLKNVKFDDIQSKPTLKKDQYKHYYIDDRYNCIFKVAKIKEIKLGRDVPTNEIWETSEGYRFVTTYNYSGSGTKIYKYFIQAYFNYLITEINKTDSFKTKIKKFFINMLERW